MFLGLLLALSSPVPWLLLAGFASIWRRSSAKNPGTRRCGIFRGATLDVGAAFLFLSAAYRPNHAFLLKARIRQVEDVDEDGQGDPDSPARHLHAQLRRIRRGEAVERLAWRLK